MSEKLYHAQVLALAKSGAGAGDAPGGTRAKLSNPMCGDETEVFSAGGGGGCPGNGASDAGMRFVPRGRGGAGGAGWRNDNAKRAADDGGFFRGC